MIHLIDIDGEDKYNFSLLRKKLKKRRVSINESGPYVSAWGNKNIIRNYVAYFEKKMKNEVEELQNVELEASSVHYPNFAAWIRLYTEFICNSLYWKLFRYDGNWEEVSKKGFGELKKSIIENLERKTASLSQEITDNDIKKMKEVISLILNWRHSFQHGGLPNLMRDLWYGSDEDKFHSMLNPKNHKETKEIFLNAEKLLKFLPQPTIVVTKD